MKTEFDRWILRWSLAKQKPSTLFDTLSMTTKELYSCMWNVLTVLLTMPVAKATDERSFNVLRRMKTFLRTTMHQGRLPSLGLMHIHREVPINVEKIIDSFASRKNKKLILINLN